MNDVELSLICLCLPILKELGAKWLVEYISDNPQFIGFRKAQAIDGDQSAENVEKAIMKVVMIVDMSSYYDADPEVITIESVVFVIVVMTYVN